MATPHVLNAAYLSPEQAAAALAAGALVGLPTETVYGLAADADNAQAVAAVYATKGRPADHPLIVHVAGMAQARAFGVFDDDDGEGGAGDNLGSNLGPKGTFACSGFGGESGENAPNAPAAARFIAPLIRAFWPGPLTLIVPRRAGRGTAAAGAQASIGLRCPAHAQAQAVLEACLRLQRPILGLAAPSANRFGRISPTTAAHVVADFEGRVGVVDGGPCAVGVESTIVDCTRDALVILRPGAIGAAQIAAVTGAMPLSAAQAATQLSQQAAPRASGTLAAHYAPRAPLVLFETQEDLLEISRTVGAQAASVAIYARAGTLAALQSSASSQTGHASAKARANDLAFWAEVAARAPLMQPDEAAAAAAALFAHLRQLDELAPALIVVERRPSGENSPLTGAIADRLARAAAAALPENASHITANAIT